jgi:hypothetical protein
MNVINYRVSLDMLDTSSQATIKAKKGDSACKIYITLSQNGKIYKMSEGSHATFSAKKADGTFVLYDNCAIEGDSIVYDFLSSVNEDGCQITACAGTVECEVTLFNGSEQLTSPRFTLVVDGTVYNGEELKSSNEVNFIKDLIEEAEDTITEIEEKLANGEFNGKDAVTDQEFNPASENAQSGKAVSQAIDYFMFGELSPEMYGHEVNGIASPSAVVNYVNDYVAENGGGGVVVKKWGKIDEVTLTEAISAVEFTTPFAENKYTGVVVDIEVASGGTYASQKARIDILPNSQKFGINYGFNILGSTPYTKMYYELQNGMWSGWWQSLSASANSTTHSMNNVNTMIFVDGEDWVKKVSFSCDNAADKFPVGTRIRLWGVK